MKVGTGTVEKPAHDVSPSAGVELFIIAVGLFVYAAHSVLTGAY